MKENLAGEMSNASLERTVIDEEEFFERALFQDILEMKSLKQVSEATDTRVEKLQDQAYQSLFSLYQRVRGQESIDRVGDKDEIFGVFELFFKNFYQQFRQTMEELVANRSSVKIAYILGKRSDLIINMLDHLVKEIEKDLC